MADSRPIRESAPTEPTSEKAEAEKNSHPALPQTENPVTAAIINAFPELHGLPLAQFNLDQIFIPGSGDLYQSKPNRLLTKLLTACSHRLSENILQKDERVSRIACGIAYFPFEIPYANGLLSWPLNYYALICTNHRLIFINLDYRLSHPTRYIFQIPYNNISRVSSGFYRSSLIITTVTGRIWDFTTVNRQLAAGIQKFVRGQLEQEAAADPQSLSPSQLCPACYQPVRENLISCPQCLIPYKSAGGAIKKSLLLPGTGNIYLSNTHLGGIEILGYIFTWIMTIFLVIIGIPGGFLGGGLLIMTYHLMAAFMAGRMARKGYLSVPSCPDEIPSEQDNGVISEDK